jgi:hypothetical protein
MKIRTKAPNFSLTKELNENTDKSTKFWLKIWQDGALAREYMMLTLRSIQFCHAMLLVQLWINSTRDVWKFVLVLLIPNCTRHRMITYT